MFRTHDLLALLCLPGSWACLRPCPPHPWRLYPCCSSASALWNAPNCALFCPRVSRWPPGSSRPRWGWTVYTPAGWVSWEVASCRTPCPVHSPPKQVRGGRGGPRRTERRLDGGRRSSSPRAEGGDSPRGRETSSVPRRFNSWLHGPWMPQHRAPQSEREAAERRVCARRREDRSNEKVWVPRN